MSQLAENLLTRGIVPDSLLRRGIRAQLRTRLRMQRADDAEAVQDELLAHVAHCSNGPIAIGTGAANRQHYEVPAAFFERVLGRHRKYSCGLFTSPTSSLDEAEAAMLALTCERNRLEDGMRVLDLGCGWGALSLWIAEHYPRCEVVGVSNSNSQREDILARARRSGITNLDIVTADINEFTPPGNFDRVFSVEMFEHMRNWRELLRRISSWMRPDARLFVHVFTHRSCGYPFVTNDDGAVGNDWMARHFFTGGQMPADAQMLYFQEHLQIEDHRRVGGEHYRRTADAWLANMDDARHELEPLFVRTYGDEARRMWHYWRVFFLACSELWGYRGGNEWFVSHYRLRARQR